MPRNPSPNIDFSFRTLIERTPGTSIVNLPSILAPENLKVCRAIHVCSLETTLMKRIFLSGAVLLLALHTSNADTVVYEGPVVYQAPVIYYGPVIYQASVIYQMAFNPYFNPAICACRADSRAVIYTGRGLRVYENISADCQSPTVIFFGHEQARRQGYQFTRSR